MNGRTNSNGTTTDTLQIPLDPVTNLDAVAGNAQVTLTWTDPMNKYATPEGEQAGDPDQLVSVWSYTAIVRKEGSAPTGIHDGILVAESQVHNQYQTNGYVDSGLTNDTLYYYGLFAVNKDGIESEGTITDARPVVGVAISTFPVGTLININENGAPVEYLIVNQGLPSSMYDASCNGCWLLRKDIYTTMVWGSLNNDYKNSDIHFYLNGTFLNLFDGSIQKVIKQVKIPYQNGIGSGGSVASGANGLSCKIFPLSGYEVGFSTSDNSDFPHDGAKLSYFSSGTGSAANNKRIAKYNGSATNWWLRSQGTRGTGGVWGVHSNGNYIYRIYNDTCGVRPALVLDNSSLIDENLNLIA